MSEKNITIILSNNQAMHLWGILASTVHDTTNELKRSRVFKGDGTQNKNRTSLTDLQQEQVDNVELAALLIRELEKHLDFSTNPNRGD